MERLRRLFRRTQIVEVPLTFTVRSGEHGGHVIEAYLDIEDERQKVSNIQNLWNYGFSLEKDGRRYVLDAESLNTLLAIRSMNPQVTEDDTLVSDVYPTVLQYLRTRQHVAEDPTSTRIYIHDTPLKPRAEISYDPSTGVTVYTGYAVPGHDDVVPIRALKPSPDEEYVEFDGSFYRTPHEDPTVRSWVEAQETTVPLDEVPEFFQHDLVLLKTNMNAVLTEQARNIRVVDATFQPLFQVTTDGRGWLDFMIDYEIGDYVLPHDYFQNVTADYVRPDPNSWVKVDYASIKATNDQLESLDVVKTASGYRVDITKFLSLEDAIEHIGGIAQVSAEYRHFLSELTDFKYDPEFQLPPGHEKDLLTGGITLRPYQREGIHWLNWLTSHHLHGLLADDMGLGKTIQTITVMRLLYEATGTASHSLVICPKSVIGHWRREITRGYPNSSVYVYLGQTRDRYRFRRTRPTIFLTTYATMSRDIDILSEYPFFFIVLDEGTRIKNPDAKRSLAAKSLNAVHRLVLSGTPIENRPLELWSLFDFLMKGHLGSHGRFITDYERPIQADDQTASAMLAKRIRPFILRRLKEDVAKDLPEKIEMRHWCELTDEQKALYGQLQDRYVSPLRQALQRGEYVNYATTILPIITKLKQVCDHPALITGEADPILGRSEKFDFIAELMAEVVERDEAAVLFSYFLGTLDLFESYLRERGVSYIRIDGSTRNRQALIDRFNAGNASIALCSLMAAGHGINLTAASHVIHVDRWWNPAVEDQATDRVHRIGQTQTVYVYKVLTEETLEEKIDALLEKKRGLSDRVIGAATRGVTGWTREELLEILQPIERVER